MSEASLVLCLFLVLLVPLAQVGLALINTGLGRARSAAHSMLTSICVVSIAAVMWIFAGSAIQGYPALVATGSFDLSPKSLTICLQLFSVSLAAMIPLGAAADRWRLKSMCLSTALFAGITYPLFAHWVGNGGWLARLGFLDTGGSATIQTTGGLGALAITWILGARRGKYGPDGRPAAIPGHHAVFVILGCGIALVGWMGLNGAGTLLFTAKGSAAVILAAINTMVCAATASLTAALVTRFRFGRPDASLSANGWLGGLAASSAGCALFIPGEAVLVGIVAGLLVVFSVEFLELRLFIDDPSGAISVHGLGGIWGIVAAALFFGFPGHAVAQLAGLATLLGFIFPWTFGLNWLLNRVQGQRVSAEAERMGLDLHELGAGAYPEFVTHTEDFSPRR